MKLVERFDKIMETIKNDYILKEKAFEYVMENYYDEVKEAVFEQEAESRRE